MILNDSQIISMLCERIKPFEPQQIRRGVISYGVSSAGYDIRLGRNFKVFEMSPEDLRNRYRSDLVIDPKNDDWHQMLLSYTSDDYCIIPANSFALAESVEHVSMPDDVIAVCVGKSTYARCGLILNVTPIEPGWSGVITLEISNTTPMPAVVHVGEGIGQLLFFQTERPFMTYQERSGKYMDQKGLTLPIVED